MACTLASAETIHFVGVPTGVNDGAYYVTPYEITIDGASQLVTCYDTHDDVNFGDTWQANILTLEQASASGYFAGADSLASYKKVAWLDRQTYSNTEQQVGLQHAIWNVFGSAPTDPVAAGYDAAANVAASNGFAGFDFSGFRFIEQVGGISGAPGTEQAFVYERSPSTSGSLQPAGSVAGVPEPGSLSLWLCGAGLLGVWRYVPRSRRSKSK